MSRARREENRKEQLQHQRTSGLTGELGLAASEGDLRFGVFDLHALDEKGACRRRARNRTGKRLKVRKNAAIFASSKKSGV
jgi:hypothetical protein